MANAQKNFSVNVDDIAKFIHEKCCTDTPDVTPENIKNHVVEHSETIKSKRGRKKGSTNKKKKTKDPDAPKRPLSGYMEYLVHHRVIMKQSNPEMKNTELVSQIAKNWKELEDKSEWEAKSKANKIRYLEEKAKYDEKKASASDTELSPTPEHVHTPTPQHVNEPTPVMDEAIPEPTLAMVTLEGTDYQVDFSVTPNKLYAADDATKMVGVLVNGKPSIFS